MATTTPVVTKYLACTEFDQVTGECSALVYVDAPGFIPALSIEEGGFIAILIGAAWIAVSAFSTINDAARDN